MVRYKVACAASAVVFAFATQSAAQSPQTMQVQTSEYLKELIGKIEANSGTDITTLLSSTLPSVPVESNGQMIGLPNLTPIQNVDFGYAVIDGSGDPIDLFGPNAPAVFSEDSSMIQAIKGYTTPENATIQIVGKLEYDQVQKQLLDEMRDDSKTQATGVTIGQVGQKAQQATTALLIEICPQPYYAEGLTLYMDAGLDFVVFNTGTGTELNFNFSRQCSTFLDFIELEAKRRGLIPE